MGMSRVIAAAAVVALLATSSALAAGTKRVSQTGSVKGDAAAVVELAVVKADGAPNRVANVRFKHLRTSCSKGTARIKLRLLGTVKVDGDREFANTYGTGKSKVRLEGKVSRDSSRVRGSIEGTTVRIDGAGRCDVPSAEFTTKR